MTRRRRRLLVVGAVLLSACGVICAGYYSVDLVHPGSAARAGTSADSGTPAAAASGPVVDVLTSAGLVRGGVVDAAAVRSLVDKLPADTHARTPAYDRAAYGPSWADTDHNGCDQRNDVLARDLTAVTYTKADPGCTVATGHLADVYTGRSIDFTSGKTTSAAVQIDHLVPLGWAWQHGAAGWTGERREQLATDFNNLQAVDGPTNEAKSDQGPATWLPPAVGYDCLYVTRFAYVLRTYELTIDDADRAAIDRTLDGCSSPAAG
ncbi:HNH endonuclease family protein [Clavibacter michiganensis]|uniref:HNH endonuclease family protein n=1 Tax=Clavibacter michiganensis TaxID=28447 RepID=UPI00201E6E3D|nr:HNH endonuclease family protein [Clavibacter michiganensis]MDO4019618.1 HNH endonuclease family protein [Clavibacter michiganensis]MDO4033298.1 HNH endonuclease family protein [Clavibacter michiganensis]MDO4039640.1 HNH endonuclease family protein [Clavibacter michiganensis]MDO4042687.1 HNH endonuclease family protein [Clavibacter michiganensis]MDO4051699.1 HNH endonuclease family protein [Clavibacter michiganensis]